MFFGFSKKRKKRNHLVMQPLITQLPEVGIPVSDSHQHQTSCSEVCGHKKLYATENCV